MPQPKEPRSQQGRAVLAALQELDHPTAEELYLHLQQQKAPVSMATVYRNLEALERAGTIRVREVGGAKRYDPNLEPHVHIHDSRQDRLLDVPLTPRLRKALAEVADQYLMEHDDSIIELRGTLKEKHP